MMPSTVPLSGKAKSVACKTTRGAPCAVPRPAAPIVGRRQLAVPRAASAELDEVALLEKALLLAKERVAKSKEVAAAPAAAPGGYTGPAFTIKTYNAISPIGLQRFPKGKYVVSGDDAALPSSPMAIMLRSHQLKVEEVPHTVRCIVRCGAGVNNIPVQKMTELGIPVFNTPGANANAVKELVICGLLLASRGIIEGNKHVENVIYKEEKEYEKAAKRIEKDKAMFVGTEIQGKTLGVVGLGAIGGLVVNAALALGMKVVGFDPVLSLDAAWKLPGDRMQRANSLEDLLKVSDYITVHVPYIKNATHHMLNGANLELCKPGVHLLNFSRGEIIDGEALLDMYKSGRMTGKYVSDFADQYLSGHPKHIVIPHLGASTEEAEDNSAAMAADTIKDFLETGTIRNSVNFPQTVLDKKPGHIGGRLCIVNKNEAGVLGQITTYLGTRNVNIEQQINTSRGDIAYTVLDFANVEDPAGLQEGLAKACPGIISSRFIGNVFDDELGKPGTFYYVQWAQ
ncbi:hypothetical protein PLESTB_001194100 [Pleodorina starrii]|uniref:Phosphoglycerate dehydrogenase n=1 Tax=Pleodorina starrii TaxID=330485 RepID=A0A9W6F5E0_9CHLO|nr:hypothetical protein PLESTM_001831300 [Pleodorina starrii]GLC57163.1 hypothetical protein PLESTB_001194100 [Pleodorina starrii]GLC71455.1 hypothetical protein PLESTF_001117700 [Pleodorina starrii]